MRRLWQRKFDSLREAQSECPRCGAWSAADRCPQCGAHRNSARPFPAEREDEVPSRVAFVRNSPETGSVRHA